MKLRGPCGWVLGRCVVQELAAVTARESLGDAVPGGVSMGEGVGGGVGRVAFGDCPCVLWAARCSCVAGSLCGCGTAQWERLPGLVGCSQFRWHSRSGV